MGWASSRAPQNAPMKRGKRRVVAPSAGSRDTEVYCSHSGALTDNQREEGSLVKPSASDAAYWRAQQAEIRALVDYHAALAWEFRALHEQARALQTQDDVSRAERRGPDNTPSAGEGRGAGPAAQPRGDAPTT